jgi:hypothetical protein
MSGKKRSAIKLQPRDFELLQGLFESRVMTLPHISAVYFDSKGEMAKKRVQKLKKLGVIRERSRRRIPGPSILHLGWKGYLSLRDGGFVDDDSRLSPRAFTRRMRVSPLTLAHEIAIGDVMSAYILAIRESASFKLLEFSVWPRRYGFSVDREYRRIPVQPDGYLRILEKDSEDASELHYFLELDKGSETVGRLAEKCVNYREYERSGRYAEFCGFTKEERKSRPFQVLVVCKTEERRNNLAKRLLEMHPPFSTMILIATLGECVRDPLGEIWMTAAAFKSAAGLSDSVHDRDVKIRPLFCSIFA